jgi:hypothetical protein
LSASYTPTDLAAVLGVQPETIRRLEASDPKMLSVLTGQQLITLADHLGTNVDALLVSNHRDQPELTPDSSQLLAVLHGQPRHVKKTHLAQVLGWNLHRLETARAALDAALRTTGLTVRETPRGWRIALLEEAATRAVSIRLEAHQADMHGMERATASVLYEVYREANRLSDRAGGRAPGRDRIQRLTHLERLGTITHADQHSALSPSLRFALNLP